MGIFANGAATAAFSYAVGQSVRSNQRADSGEVNGYDLSPERRQEMFDAAEADLQKRGVLGGHELEFVNEYATARIDSEGYIILDSVDATHETYSDALKAAAESPSIRTIAGRTTIGEDSSIIYANATLERAKIDTGTTFGYPANYSRQENIRFSILHEYQHGLGVIKEVDANIAARDMMREIYND